MALFFVYHFLLLSFRNLCAIAELTFPVLTPRKSNAAEIRQASMTDSVNSFLQTSIISSKHLRDSRLWVSSSTSLFSSLSVEFPLVKEVQAEITESKWTFTPFLRAWPASLVSNLSLVSWALRVYTWQYTNVKMNASCVCALRHFAFTWGLQNHMFYCNCSLWEFFRKVLHVWDSQHVQVSPNCLRLHLGKGISEFSFMYPTNGVRNAFGPRKCYGTPSFWFSSFLCWITLSDLGQVSKPLWVGFIPPNFWYLMRHRVVMLLPKASI